MFRFSLVSRLQTGFAISSALVIGSLGLLLDGAVERALDNEDEAVLRGQAAEIAQALRSGGGSQYLGGSRFEKAEWRALDRNGGQLAQSWGFAKLPAVAWPKGEVGAREAESADGLLFTRFQHPLENGGTLQLLLDRTHEAHLLRGYRAVLWASALLAALASTLIGRWIAVRGLRPLRFLEQHAARLAADRLSERIAGVGYPVEMQGLVVSLNGALQRLQDSFARMTALSSDLAHELRTPLQNLRAMLEGALLRGDRGEALQAKIGEALEELDRLTAMIEQMMFLARAEDPRAAVQRAELAVSDELEAVKAFFAPVADERQVAIAVACPPDLRLRADRALLQRALHNLVANAIAHGPGNAEIAIRAGSGPAGPWIAVADQGAGIPDSVRQRLGERFVRDDPSRARLTGGSGLGLAIVSAIMRLHGGALVLDERGAVLQFGTPSPAPANMRGSS